MNSDDILLALTRYGRPYVFCATDMTWSASLTCNTTTEGANFETKSGFNHPTPLAALSELLRRTEVAMAQVAAAATRPADSAIEHKRPTLLERLRK